MAKEASIPWFEKLRTSLQCRLKRTDIEREI